MKIERVPDTFRQMRSMIRSQVRQNAQKNKINRLLLKAFERRIETTEAKE